MSENLLMKRILQLISCLLCLSGKPHSDTSVSTLLSSCPVITNGDGGSLTISGDIIAEWQHYRTTSRGHSLRGSGAKIPSKYTHSCKNIPTNEYTTQVDLIFDYTNDRTYSRIQLEFENDDGILSRVAKSKKNCLSTSAKFSDRQLLEAFMGYHLMNKTSHTLALEIGRRRLFDLFDSKVEFASIFDGISLAYWRANEKWGSFQMTAAAFVIDKRANKFGYAAEVDFFGIKKTRFDFKYSLISWNRHGHNRYGLRYPQGTRFCTSQYLLYYNLPNIHDIDPSIYAAFLHNHAATTNRYTHHKKAANAFYLGTTIGQVKKKKDWSLDINYQWVQAQAIPECDVNGIGRDNPLDYSFYQHRWAGTANYKGFIATYIYGITDNLTATIVLQRVAEANRSIGGKFRASSLQLSTTYSF